MTHIKLIHLIRVTSNLNHSGRMVQLVSNDLRNIANKQRKQIRTLLSSESQVQLCVHILGHASYLNLMQTQSKITLSLIYELNQLNRAELIHFSTELIQHRDESDSLLS